VGPQVSNSGDGWAGPPAVWQGLHVVISSGWIARWNDGAAGAAGDVFFPAAVLSSPGLRGVAASPSSAGGSAVGGGGASGGAGGFFLRPSSLRMSERFFSCGLCARALAAGSRPSTITAARQRLRAIDVAPRARGARDRERGPAVVTAAAEFSLLHLGVREAGERLRKDPRMTGVATERLMRPVREQRAGRKRRGARIAARDAQH